MAQTHAPSCATTPQQRATIWRRAQEINAANRKPRGQGPITHAYAKVLHYMLWWAPRKMGVLIPSIETIALKAGTSTATVKRANDVFRTWGLMRIHARVQTVQWPVMIGHRLHRLRQKMTASNAYTFPTIDQIGVAQTDPVVDSLRNQRDRRHDGRWVPAAVTRKMSEVRARMLAMDPADDLLGQQFLTGLAAGGIGEDLG